MSMVESLQKTPSGLWRVSFDDGSEVWVPDYLVPELEATANARQVAVDAFRAVAANKRAEQPSAVVKRPKAKLTTTSRRTNGPSGEPIPPGPKIAVELVSTGEELDAYLDNSAPTSEPEVVEVYDSSGPDSSDLLSSLLRDSPPQAVRGGIRYVTPPPEVPVVVEVGDPETPPQIVDYAPDPPEAVVPSPSFAKLCVCGHPKRRHAQGACTVHNTQFEGCSCILFRAVKEPK